MDANGQRKRGREKVRMICEDGGLKFRKFGTVFLCVDYFSEKSSRIGYIGKMVIFIKQTKNERNCFE